MDFDKIKKMTVALAIHVAEFLIIAWILLGMNPFDVYDKAKYQMTQYKNVIGQQFHLFFDASSRLGDKANKYGLNEAKSVRDGKDPYQDGYMMQIDDEIKQNIGR